MRSILFVVLLCQAASAATMTVQQTVSYFGTLDQHSLEYSYPQYGTGGGNMACAPTAGINSVVYLGNRYPQVFGSSLIQTAPRDMDNNGVTNIYDNWIYSTGSSGMAKYAYMNTTQQNGTWHDNFIRGLAAYVTAKAPGMATYSAQDYWSPTYWGNAPSTYPPPSWVLGQTPTWNFIYDGLVSGNAVLSLLAYTGGGGHVVSVTGVTWDTVANTGTMSYMDPWTGSAGSTGIRLSSGRINTDYGGTNGSWIGATTKVMVVPEPGCLVLLVMAMGFLALGRTR